MEDLRRQIGDVQRGLEERAQKDHDLLIELKTINQAIVGRLQELDSHTTRQITALEVRVGADIAALKVQIASERQAQKIEIDGVITVLKADVESLKRTKYMALGAVGLAGVIGGWLSKLWGK